MFEWFAAAREFSHGVAMIAALAFAFGTIRRRFASKSVAVLALGGLFGLSAVLAMLDPVAFAPGVIIDMRSIPMALAGGYLGWAGTAVALMVSGAMRLWIGGAGAVSGLLGLTLAGAAGLVWRFWRRGKGRIRLEHLLVLGLMSSAGLGGFALLPGDLAQRLMLTLGPLLIPMNALGVLLVGLVLERENRLLANEVALVTDGITDPLTGLLNRRGFQAAAAQVAAATGPELGEGVLVIDIDHFKSVNDRLGHVAGDLVLRAVAQCLGSNLRSGDKLARIGGEEFAVYLRSLTRRNAVDLADQLRRRVNTLVIQPGEGLELRVTVSIGVHWARDVGDLTAALSAADAALYRAKRAGRDQVALAA